MVKLTDCLERGCGDECCGEYYVILTDEEVKSEKYEMKRVVNPETSERFMVLKVGLDLKCVYLENSQCSIYENRPGSCKEWLCDK